MKRSDAVRLIADIIYFHSEEYKGAKNSYTEKEIEVAEDILSNLEDAGMMPPSIYLDMFKRYDNGWESESKSEKAG